MVTYLGEYCKVHPRAPSGSLASKDHASNRRVQVHRGPHVHQLLPHAHIHGIPLHKNCKSEDASPPASQDARQTVKGCLSGTIERYRRNAGRRLRNLQASRRSRSMATMATTAACTPIHPGPDSPRARHFCPQARIRRDARGGPRIPMRGAAASLCSLPLRSPLEVEERS
jgi:hypothetical protein